MSSAEGTTPRPISADTASLAASTDANSASVVRTASASGSSRTVASVPMPSVPSDPNTRPTRSIPVVFFFQAEDGIRVATVTGVQTCALPIFMDEPAQHIPPLDTQAIGGLVGRIRPRVRRPEIETALGPLVVVPA